MSPISIPSCPEACVVLAVFMAQPGMSCMFGQNAEASTWLQPLTKSREITQMRRSLFITNSSQSIFTRKSVMRKGCRTKNIINPVAVSRVKQNFDAPMAESVVTLTIILVANTRGDF